MSEVIQIILLVFLVACALAVSLTKNLFVAVIVFMGYSSIMAVIWLFLESPDLAITEAAVGAGVDSILFFLTLKKVHYLKGTREG
ncbi:putative monovalent cation/H+ antiporter subunit B [Anaerotignum neopropionicum]|uniref:Putative monovalent cation/H+ antiporter subunit B n=1 Tax=Anaerotignum neopropionicum TaxID=36847 RepID=A0A136WFJ1_9FIRM|nr:hydrogenase subunit MbhD domain-containing protein [Anaerotignum neopropionicum]KXL53326.1 putative monovalent cation/H+ antiporter subunit B [Anaerotignum neopropionicum]